MPNLARNENWIDEHNLSCGILWQHISKPANYNRNWKSNKRTSTFQTRATISNIYITINIAASKLDSSRKFPAKATVSLRFTTRCGAPPGTNKVWHAKVVIFALSLRKVSDKFKNKRATHGFYQWNSTVVSPSMLVYQPARGRKPHSPPTPPPASPSSSSTSIRLAFGKSAPNFPASCDSCHVF